jgi:hypothetical protein
VPNERSKAATIRYNTRMGRAEAEIRKAVRDCADICGECPEPLKCLEAYARALIANEWSGEDVDAFRRLALEKLSRTRPATRD